MAFIYNNALKLMADNTGRINFLSDTLKWMLVDNTYVADRDHVNVSAAAASELTGTGYTPGFGSASRKTVASKTLTVDNVNNRYTLGAANPTWTAINAGTAHALILIKEVTSDTDSLLIAYIDSPADFTTNGGDLTAQLPGGLIGDNTSS